MWLVDGQVGGDGTLEALLAEDFGGGFLRGGLGGCESDASSAYVRDHGGSQSCCPDVPLLDGAAGGRKLEAGGGGAAQAELEYSLRSHCRMLRN